MFDWQEYEDFKKSLPDNLTQEEYEKFVKEWLKEKGN